MGEARGAHHVVEAAVERGKTEEDVTGTEGDQMKEGEELLHGRDQIERAQKRKTRTKTVKIKDSEKRKRVVGQRNTGIERTAPTIRPRSPRGTNQTDHIAGEKDAHDGR